MSVNLHSLHHDPNYWIDPDSFIPQRHLVNGRKEKNKTHFLPFSAGNKRRGFGIDLIINSILIGTGKRMCLGEPLARNTYFLFVTTLLKQFHFEFAVSGAEEDGTDKLPSLEPVNGLAMGYQSFKARIKPRLV